MAALLLALAGCSDPPLIDGDAAVGPTDAGTGAPDSGGSTFRDGGGISINGLSLARVVPDHGPFTGGNQVVLRGTGFTAEAQVAFGGNNVQGADHRLIDPRRLAVVVPAGDPGTVDVSITVGDTTVTLEDGYTYDSIEITPSSGSVAGNTFVSLIGSGTRFAEGDTVTIGRTACNAIEVVSETRINCRTPPGAPGSVDVTVHTDGADVVIEDGFTYFDSADPTSGGLGGGPIEGQINITVIDAMTGAPVADAYAIVGEDTTTEHQGLTDGGGQISFSGPDILPAGAGAHREVLLRAHLGHRVRRARRDGLPRAVDGPDVRHGRAPAAGPRAQRRLHRGRAGLAPRLRPRPAGVVQRARAARGLGARRLRLHHAGAARVPEPPTRRRAAGRSACSRAPWVSAAIPTPSSRAPRASRSTRSPASRTRRRAASSRT
ncbi:MAG: IPT/TIG domain-containing protein [Sandaracinaceae bacterium]|nr:IPT/TIG domain-containing protein [Sandaracinaceae bacterium]